MRIRRLPEARDPVSGIRDFEALEALARAHPAWCSPPTTPCPPTTACWVAPAAGARLA